MNGRMNKEYERMNGLIIELINGWLNERINERMNEQRND
jgi:hypothetical protein